MDTDGTDILVLRVSCSDVLVDIPNVHTEVCVLTHFDTFHVLNERHIRVQCSDAESISEQRQCPVNHRCTLVCEPISLRVLHDRDMQQIFRLRVLSVE
jgi:hypothetical protein